ncbi:Anaerobic sulfatase-maturating enzyme homolog YdeM [uncultured Clostridium sp.]|nr:Anaerobic sulfatase-maturating enzyme homolog YdeM [uncultured Clostridium sp.]
MKESKPFIHLFKTPKGCYCYDVNTNQILPVSQDVYAYLEQVMDGGELEASMETASQLESLRRQGYFSSQRPKKIEHELSELLEHYLQHDVEQVLLQLTQNCNFRCDYCAYVPHEYDRQRHHAQRQMSWETAKAAIDFFVAHSGNHPFAMVGLYGGEPLLAFDLIEKLVPYAEQALEGKRLSFLMTTNGSLFTPERMAFLAEHQIQATVSLDGSRERHNLSRKFAANGKGTYDVVLDNLRRLKRAYPDYFRNCIGINLVMDPRFGCEETYRIFQEDELFDTDNIRMNMLDDTFSLEKSALSQEFAVDYNIGHFKAYQSLVGRYPAERLSPLVYANVREALDATTSAMVPTKRLLNRMSPAGPCMPGRKKIFIDVDGIFYPCEKVSETSEVMRIGNVKDGFDYAKARALLNVGALTQEQCKNCWALRHCKSCARACDNNGELSAALRLSMCHEVRRQVENELRDYTLLREFGWEREGV